MKLAVVVPDGLADEPLSALGGKTPMEAARAPAIAQIAAEGMVGLVRTIPQGMPPGSDVANLSLFGFNPRESYTGRAPLEAESRGIPLGDAEWVYRANLVTVADGRMADYSAGQIPSAEAAALIEALAPVLAARGFRLHAGVSYRHLAVDAEASGKEIRTTPPHDILGESVERHLPVGLGAERLIAAMEASVSILESHDVNRVRRDLGENPATQLWLWGQGTKPHLSRIAEAKGLRAAVISAVDLVRGIARLAGCEVLDVPGATGGFDTDYAAKGRAAVAALENHDLVFVHVEATDEAGHNALVDEKVRALERIDEHIVAPLRKALPSFGPWRILVCPDHPTPIRLRTHTGDPVPFAAAGDGIPASSRAFSERSAAASGVYLPDGFRILDCLRGAAPWPAPRAASMP